MKYLILHDCSILYTLAYVIYCQCIYYMLCIVYDADGDNVRCRWAESDRGECGEVCQNFLLTLSQVHMLNHHYYC